MTATETLSTTLPAPPRPSRTVLRLVILALVLAGVALSAAAVARTVTAQSQPTSDESQGARTAPARPICHAATRAGVSSVWQWNHLDDTKKAHEHGEASPADLRLAAGTMEFSQWTLGWLSSRCLDTPVSGESR